MGPRNTPWNVYRSQVAKAHSLRMSTSSISSIYPPPHVTHGILLIGQSTSSVSSMCAHAHVRTCSRRKTFLASLPCQSQVALFLPSLPVIVMYPPPHRWLASSLPDLQSSVDCHLNFSLLSLSPLPPSPAPAPPSDLSCSQSVHKQQGVCSELALNSRKIL